MPGQTINGALRLYNSHALLPEELIVLNEMFNEMNNNEVPKPGMTMKIPLWTLGTCLRHYINE